MSDDLRRKPVAFVADLLCLHRHRLRPDHSTSNLRPVKVTAPIKQLVQPLMARDFDRQVAEIQVRVAVLNRYTAFGIPVTVAAG